MKTEFADEVDNIILRVVTVTPDWMPFSSIGGWTQAVPVKESESLKYYEVAIWEETNSIHLYEFTNDYDPFYGFNPLDKIADQQKIDYRESFRLYIAENIPESDGSTDKSAFISDAFKEIASILVEANPNANHHLSYNGHGGPGGALFAGDLSFSDTGAFLKYWTDELGRNLGVIDMGGPCNKGSFSDLDNFTQYSDYYIASDLPNGGYTFDVFSPEQYSEVNPDYQYHSLFLNNSTLEEVLIDRIDLKRDRYLYSIENMVEKKVEQANYLYSSKEFESFSVDFKMFVDRAGVDYQVNQDLYQFMLDYNASSDLINKYNSVFVHKADNKDFFAWEKNSNGMLMPHSSHINPPLLEASSEGNIVDVEWVKSAGASGYKLFYGEESGEYVNDKNGIDIGSGTSITFDNVPVGNYYISLKGYDKYGNESVDFSLEEKVTVNGIDLQAPTNFNAYMVGDLAILEWNHIDDASGYSLHYRTD
ncbi:MAG: hypothetical protein HOE61_08595, partial [Candidatus Marinimicrobia bacterium]|nr:hypothetical protein [Candidatus Neomarinimicrobiota bacterium]